MDAVIDAINYLVEGVANQQSQLVCVLTRGRNTHLPIENSKHRMHRMHKYIEAQEWQMCLVLNSNGLTVPGQL